MILNLDVQNTEILAILNSAANMNLRDNADTKSRGFEHDEYDIISQYAVSKSYLNERMKNDSSRIAYATNSIIGETTGGKYLLDSLLPILNYETFYTSGYDPKGFVGWHSDTDIFGYYIMLSYSESGDGLFRYFSGSDIITLQDNKGWMVRMMTLGSTKDDAVWHCASTNCPRYTFLLHFNDKEKYNKAVKIIQDKA